MSELKRKMERLEKTLNQSGSLLIAFSGGVDSTFLLAVAARVLGDRVMAATAASPIHPECETAFASDFARRLGVRHFSLPSREMQQEAFVENSKDRCYICKKTLIQDLRQLADNLGLVHIAHGANRDDLNDYRPGFEAAREAGLIAPLIDASLSKKEIRQLSHQMGLSTWDKPSMACLASRIPYGEPISLEKLEMIDKAETYIRDLGFSTCRVRHHGPLARIELDPAEIDRMLRPEVRNGVIRHLQRLGFVHVALDLEGYRQGSMNRTLDITGS